MRTSGIIPYITPRQIATESSTTPKSVMNTIVGGYLRDESLAAHAPQEAIIISIIASATMIVLPERNSPRRTEDEFIQFSSSSVIGYKRSVNSGSTTSKAPRFLAFHAVLILNNL